VSNFLRHVTFDKLDYEWTYVTMISPAIWRMPPWSPQSP